MGMAGPGLATQWPGEPTGSTLHQCGVQLKMDCGGAGLGVYTEITHVREDSTQ